MANTIRDYSATAASNTTVDGADISEGCSPAGINDAIRGVMADLKDVSTGAVSLESPAADSLSLSGALTTTSTIDGRDVAADGTKLDGIEAGADVTNATNVTAAGALMDSEVTNLAQVKAFDSADYATAAQGTTADAALPRTGGAMTGAITTNSTFDGRDVATDGAKLDGIASGANNYVHPNHTGEVTSTGDGATVIADNVVDEANLKVSNAPTNGYALTAQSGAAGGLTWAAVSGGGASLELYAENPSTPTNPAAGGNNSVAIGNNAVVTNAASGSTGDKSIAIGHNSSVTNNNAIAAGRQATVSGSYASGFGYNATSAGIQSHAATNSYASGTNSFAAAIANNTSSYGATGNYSVAIGNLAKSTGLNAISFGEGAIASGNSSLALSDSTASANNAVSIGVGATASGSSAVAIGKSANSAHTNSVAIGRNAVTTAIDQITVGDSTATVRISEAYTLPTTDGTSGQVMTTDGSGTVSFTTVSGGGGSPDLYAESYDGTSTAPSATGTNSVAIGKSSTASGQESMAILDGNSVSQDSFSMGGNVYANAIGGIQIGKGGIVGGYGSSANYGVSIGYQGIAAQIESIAIGKGYAGGVNSFAAQITNNSSSYGATGQYGIAIGYLAKASSLGGTSVGYGNIAGTYATAIGYLNTSTSQKSAILGSENVVSGNGGVCIGQVNYVQTAGGVAIGKRADSRQNYQIAFAAGYFATNGDAQGSMYILRAATTDATPTVLTTTNAAGQWYNQITAQSDSCITFDGTITAMQNGAQSYASWRVEGLLVNDGGTTTVANSAITTIYNTPSWGLTLTADNTNNSLAITFTGESGHNIRTVANIRTSEVIYA